MLKAILFDFDDTLLQTAQSKFAALKYTAKKFYNLELTDEEIRNYWGLPFTVFLRRLYKDIEPVALIIEKYAQIRILYPNSAYSDTIETLETLQKTFSLGIVTAATLKVFSDDMAAAGVSTELFSYIQTEEETAIHKPDPRVFDPILEKLKKNNIEKHEIFFVGDHLYDFYAASGAGLDFYGVADRTTPKETFRRKGAKTIDTLKDLLAFVK